MAKKLVTYRLVEHPNGAQTSLYRDFVYSDAANLRKDVYININARTLKPNSQFETSDCNFIKEVAITIKNPDDTTVSMERMSRINLKGSLNFEKNCPYPERIKAIEEWMAVLAAKKEQLARAILDSETFTVTEADA